MTVIVCLKFFNYDSTQFVNLSAFHNRLCTKSKLFQKLSQQFYSFTNFFLLESPKNSNKNPKKQNFTIFRYPTSTKNITINKTQSGLKKLNNGLRSLHLHSFVSLDLQQVLAPNHGPNNAKMDGQASQKN